MNNALASLAITEGDTNWKVYLEDLDSTNELIETVTVNASDSLIITDAGNRFAVLLPSEDSTKITAAFASMSGFNAVMISTTVDEIQADTLAG